MRAKALFFGYWISAIGYWLLAIGYWVLGFLNSKQALCPPKPKLLLMA